MKNEFEILFNSTQDALFLLKVSDNKFRYVFNNAAHEELTGLSTEYLYGKTVREVLGDVLGEKNERYCKECLMTKKTVTFEEEFIFKGEKLVLMTKLSPFFKTPKEVYIVGSRVDITHLKLSLERSSQMAEKFNAMFEHHTATMLLIDPDTGKIIDANPSSSEFYGYSIAELKTMNINEINTLDQEEIIKLRNLANQKSQKYFLFPHRLKSGEIRFVDVYSSPIEYGGKKVLYSIIFDVTEREKSKEALRLEKEHILYLSNHDILTGLYNRRIFQDICKKYNYEELYPLAVVMGDVNGLKMTNDAFGHEAGDQLLTSISDAIKESIHQNDTAIRWGGDEFVIMLPNSNIGQIESFIHSVIDKVKKIKINGIIEASISFGYALKVSRRQKEEDLLQEAEEMMYQNKLNDSRAIRKNMIATIQTLLRSKDMETMEHAKRMETLCTSIGRKMKLRQEELRSLSVLSSMHDIGKIGIEDTILLKKEALDEAEWEEIRRHSEIGYRIALNMPEISGVADCILYHHEKWDGSGYPRNLKQQEIPLCSRIIAIADAYDVMIHDQVYKKAVTKEAALHEIKSQAGKHFDPEIVEVFLNCV
ncbi:MAG: diguanylate cyclase [Lachnospiraceae bacterium]|nr:diguanylate cyclase [Lachnospiraceae bacterium]MDD3660169.1 diguanylate cyclase [Lachnospiraceae bacterium]